MEWPYQFPHPADVIADEAKRTQQLSVEERMDLLLAMIGTGWALAHRSPTWVAQGRFKRRQEVEWNRAHSEAFKRHGR